jgi:hypothetical protein
MSKTYEIEYLNQQNGMSLFDFGTLKFSLALFNLIHVGSFSLAKYFHPCSFFFWGNTHVAAILLTYRRSCYIWIQSAIQMTL